MGLALSVIGDSLLDVDIEGEATRIAPESPAPVLEGLKELVRPGGAALAAQMLAMDGHEVTLVTALADDQASVRLRSLLGRVKVIGLEAEGTLPVKRRVRSRGHTIVRLDEGGLSAIPDELPDAAACSLETGSAVLVSDYGNGITSLPAIRQALALRAQQMPIVWDPHPRGAVPVPGVRAVTPNVDEALQFAQVSGASSDYSTLRQLTKELRQQWRASAVVVTAGRRGALFSYGEHPAQLVPASTVVESDSCGAGDRFAASLVAAVADGEVLSDAVMHAVHDAGAFIAGGGVGKLRTSDEVSALSSDPNGAEKSTAQLLRGVRSRGGSVVAAGGCFDLLHAGHVEMLHGARRLGDALVVLMNSDDSVRRLKGSGRPIVPAADRKRVLEALSCVDAVEIFDEDTPVKALDRLRPDVWIKGGDYLGQDIPEATMVESWGGTVLVLPYLRGRSSSRLVESARATTHMADER
ncbi:MAG: PfkB family carbohydrate kinase [Actinomycetes bacterium]